MQSMSSPADMLHVWLFTALNDLLALQMDLVYSTASAHCSHCTDEQAAYAPQMHSQPARLKYVDGPGSCILHHELT